MIWEGLVIRQTMHKYGKKYTKRAKWCDDNPESIATLKSKVEVSVKESVSQLSP